MQFSSTNVTALKTQTTRSRKLVWRLGGVLTCAALVTGALAQGDAPDNSGEIGLKGILPASASERLSESIQLLPDSWQEWGSGVLADLNQFYADTAPDVAGQRAALEALKDKVATIDAAITDPKYASVERQLVGLRNGLSRRIDVIEAVLDTLTAPAEGSFSTFDNAKSSLGDALDTAENYLNRLKGGASWKTYLQTSVIRSALAENTDPASLLEVLSPLNDKAQAATNSDNAAIKDFLAHPDLRVFVSKLGSTVATLKRATTGVNMEEVRAQLKALVEGLENYENTGTTASAKQVRAAFSLLRQQAADGGERLSTVLRQHYFNYNMQVSISEGFFNRVLAKTHIEEGGVNDFILGANVYGCQITSSVARFDLLPSVNGAMFNVHLTGTVTTNTDSHKGRVTIFSNGNHSFVAQKQVIFDGELFSTTPANMHVSASNEPFDASTPADRLPIVGGLFKSVAMNEAIRKRPEAEAVAAQRVTSRVGPEFDDEVDNKFGEINQKLQTKVKGPLKAEGLYPDAKHFQSSDTQFDYHSRLMGQGELGGGKANIRLAGDGELVFQMHESLINNFMDRLEVHGKTMTEEELRNLLEAKLSKLLSKEVTLKKKEKQAEDEDPKQPKAFIFTQVDPLRVKVADGQVFLLLRTGFERDEAQGGNIPSQIVTIPLRFELEGDNVLITRGSVVVDSLEKVENVGEQVARAGVIKKKLESSIPETKRDTRTMKVDKVEGDPIDVSITGIEASDGWVTIRLQ